MITQGGYRLDSTFNVIHRPWFDIGIDGSDEVLSVSDSGLDVDNCYFQSKNPLVRDGTIDMSQRKVVQYIPHFRNGDSYDAIDGHGTHVVGTVAGSRIDGKEGMADGIARGAKIAFFDMGEAGKCCSFQNSMDLLNTGRTGAQRQKASAMNMSWGARNNGVYNSMNAKFDTYMYENDDFLTVAAAGNSGMESGQSHILSSVGSPSSNKNGISVGASQSAGRDIYVGSMLGMDYLACFSSRGPTIDGRIKPDIVAPGFNILSARALPDEFGECDPDTRPGLLQSKEGLTFKAGTSMASPVVTGTTALVRQYLKSSYYNNQHSNPSSSLVKAVILNGGKDMKGAQDWFYGSDFIQVSPYDAHVGFGRVDLINSMPLPGSSLNAGFNLLTYDRIRIQPGDVQEYMFHIDDTCSSGTSELSVTLVWTDPPSESGCTRCLLNDIDLSLKINNGMTFFPNGKYGKDSVNNVERIRTNVQVGDEIHVSISGTNLSTEYQNYALVVTGCGLNSGEGTIPTVSPTDEPTSSPINKPSSSPTERLSLSPTVPNSNHPSSSPTERLSLSPTDSNSNHPSSSPTESFSLSTSISTGYEGKERGNGNMFSISTKSSSITITGLSIHTNEKDIVGVEIYARDGSYGGYERRPTAWKSIGSTEVKGQGEGNPTPLPLNSFEPIHIEPQSTKSIYITLSNGFLSYSAGNGSIAPIASNDEIDIFEGCGKSYKFRATYEERRWNGDIKYRVHNKGVAKTKRPTTAPTKQPTKTPIQLPSTQPTKLLLSTSAPTLKPSMEPTKALHEKDVPSKTPSISPTLRPSTIPTLEPSLTIATESPSSESTGRYFLETVYNGSLASDGVMFNIFAQKNIRIMNFRIHTALNNMASLAIYIKSNSHMGYERRPKAWREVGRIDLECAGANKPTILPDELFDTIDILEGEMYSFYITILSSNNLILSSPGTQTGSEHISNKELILQEGVGKKNLFGATTSTRQFDGAVIYEILD